MAAAHALPRDEIDDAHHEHESEQEQDRRRWHLKPVAWRDVEVVLPAASASSCALVPVVHLEPPCQRSGVSFPSVSLGEFVYPSSVCANQRVACPPNVRVVEAARNG